MCNPSNVLKYLIVKKKSPKDKKDPVSSIPKIKGKDKKRIW